MKNLNNISTSSISGLSDAELYGEVVAGENICFNFRYTKNPIYRCHVRTVIDCDNLRSKQPDLVFVKPLSKVKKKREVETYRTDVIIEIDDSSNKTPTMRKVVGLIKDYNLLEGFVYIINKREWYKFDSRGKEIILNPSYSDVLKVDFNDLLENRL